MSTKEQPISNLGLSGFIAQRVQRKDGSYRCTLRCKPKGSDKFIPAGKIDEGEFGVVIFREEFIARFPQLKDVIVIRKPDRSYVYCSAAEPASVAETCAPAPAPQAQPKPQSAAPTLQPGEHPIAELNLPGFIAQRNKRADGTYPVIRVLPTTIFETLSTAAITADKVGTSVQIDASSAEFVTATAAGPFIVTYTENGANAVVRGYFKEQPAGE